MEFPASPEFVNAPVVETVLGVEFAPLTKWQIPHFGLYWQTIRNEFPDFAIQPALTSEENRPMREERLLKAVVLQLLPAPPVRCWFHHRQKTDKSLA